MRSLELGGMNVERVRWLLRGELCPIAASQQANKASCGLRSGGPSAPD